MDSSIIVLVRGWHNLVVKRGLPTVGDAVRMAKHEF
jgi:hypothetical protein